MRDYYIFHSGRIRRKDQSVMFTYKEDEVEKRVPIPVMFEDGTLSPADTKLVWPYMCVR